MVNPIKLYGSSPVQIPPPRFIVFYNGTVERPEREELCLSRLYSVEEEEIWLELKVVVLNINMGHNKELMEACRTLWEYAEYVRRVRQYKKEMSIEEAVERTITECIAEGILKEFLTKNRAEAKAVSIYEYNEEEDTWWIPQGWYEVCDYLEDCPYIPITSEVIAWMRLSKEFEPKIK